MICLKSCECFSCKGIYLDRRITCRLSFKKPFVSVTYSFLRFLWCVDLSRNFMCFKFPDYIFTATPKFMLSTSVKHIVKSFFFFEIKSFCLNVVPLHSREDFSARENQNEKTPETKLALGSPKKRIVWYIQTFRNSLALLS